ncbi:hypothetical protein [Lysobacter sp. 22409]|uniref:hypothetical protein n=1 Tax=Lysobacter sp. 22409 TaxID=3453917 RepID=UPI003F865A40
MSRYRFAAMRLPVVVPFVVALIVAAMAGCTASSNPPVEADKASAKTPDKAAAAKPASPPQRPAQASVADDGKRIDVASAVLDFPIEAADVFDGRVLRIDRVAILGQEDRGERFDLLLRIEGPSDPKAEGGRCRDGREIVLREISFDGNDNMITGSQDYQSCLKRIRPVAERRFPDGRVEYDLKHTYPAGDTWDVYLKYDLAHPGAGVTM